MLVYRGSRALFWLGDLSGVGMGGRVSNVTTAFSFRFLFSVLVLAGG